MTATEMWDGFLQQIRKLQGSPDWSNFLEWGPIRQTMHAGDIHSGRTGTYFSILKEPETWKTWKFLGGSPITNEVNHAFYLNIFNEIYNILPNGVEQIVEFGGGFGSLCCLMRKFGFSGDYVLYDFPELIKLQEYYIKKNKFEAKFSSTFEDLKSKIEKKKILFVSMHALEESPTEVCNEMLEIAKQFDFFLFVFSGGYDTFIEYCTNNKLSYVCSDLPHIKNHYIICGKKP